MQKLAPVFGGLFKSAFLAGRGLVTEDLVENITKADVTALAVEFQRTAYRSLDGGHTTHQQAVMWPHRGFQCVAIDLRFVHAPVGHQAFAYII